MALLLLSVVVAAVAIWVVVLAWQAEPAGASRWALVWGLLLQRLGIVAVGLGWMLAVVGVGWEVGAVVVREGAPAGERWLFRAGLGLGVSAVVVLVAGSLAAFWVVWVLWALGLAALVRRGWPRRAPLGEALARRLSLGPWEWLWVLVSVVVFILALMSVFVPALAYDTLEYHLGVPARYLEAGRIVGLPGNVYSNFPLTAEMHYLVGLLVLGRVEAGALAKLFNLFSSVLAGLGVWALAHRVFGSRRVGLLALAIFATTGWFLVLAGGVVYVEPMLVAFTVLAVLALVCWRGAESGTWGLALAGLLAGFASGTKYPAVLFLVLPAAGYLALRAVVGGRGGRRALGQVGVFVGATLLAFSPWLIKNLVIAGNPVFPLLQGLLGGGGWDGPARARWAQAHPLGISQAATLLGELRGLLFRTDHELPALIFSPAAFIFVPLVAFAKKRGRGVGLLIGYVLLWVGLWLLFTHRIVRFLVPALAISVVLSAGGVEAVSTERLRALVRGAVVVLMGVSLAMARPFISTVWAVDLSRPEVFFERYPGIFPYPVSTFARGLGPGERMLAVGEARNYYFGPNVHTETVFDPKLLDRLLADDPEPEALARRLRRRGFTYLFVNWWELSRLQSTYAYEYGGGRRAGYSQRINSRLFDRLEQAGVLTLVRAFGPPLYTVESPQGWLYPPPSKPSLGDMEAGEEVTIAFHPASYMIYRIEEPGHD